MMNDLLMNDALMMFALLAVIGLGVGAYLFWSRCRSSHDKDESGADSSFGTGKVLAKITLAPRKSLH
jgi:hypothetical protein